MDSTVELSIVKSFLYLEKEITWIRFHLQTASFTLEEEGLNCYRCLDFEKNACTNRKNKNKT